MHTIKIRYTKNSSAPEDTAWLDDVKWIDSHPLPSATLKYALDMDELDTPLDVITDGDTDWSEVSSGYYGNDSARSGNINDEEVSQMAVTVRR